MTVRLSACLIVKDEEAHLPGCLTSLAAVVDEIVVYDTGSTDATTAVAAMHGATIIDGCWDDDFARARNDALDACTGEWVLSIDADERLVADPGQLLALLSGWTDAVRLPIDNLVGDGRGPLQTHYGIRLFRRSVARWHGRVHEQIGPLSDGQPLRLTTADSVRLVHLGYTTVAMRERDKIARNLRMAQSEAAQSPSPTAEFQLARCLFAADRCQEAVDHYRRAKDTTAEHGVRVAALHYGLSCLAAMDRWDEAESWIAELRGVAREQSYVDFYQAKLLRHRGKPAEAWELLESIDVLRDDLGTRDNPELLHFERIEVLGLLGRWSEAVEVALDGVRRGLSVHELPTMVNVFRLAGEPLAGLARAVPDDHRADVTRQLLRLDPAAADELAEALWCQGEGDPLLLAAMIRCAPHLPLARAVTWAERIRARSGPVHCPLVGRARLEYLDLGERARAAAVAAGRFGDLDAAALLAGLSAVPGFDPGIVEAELAGLSVTTAD